MSNHTSREAELIARSAVDIGDAIRAALALDDPSPSAVYEALRPIRARDRADLEFMVESLIGCIRGMAVHQAMTDGHTSREVLEAYAAATGVML